MRKLALLVTRKKRAIIIEEAKVRILQILKRPSKTHDLTTNRIVDAVTNTIEENL